MKKGSKDKEKEVILKRAYAALANEDEYDAYAVTVAGKLRKLSEEQRLYCENIINTALFKAALNQLSEHSTLSQTQPQNPYIPKQQFSTFNVNSVLHSQASSYPKSFIALTPLPSPQNYDGPQTQNQDTNCDVPQTLNRPTSRHSDYGNPSRLQLCDSFQSQKKYSNQPQNINYSKFQNFTSAQNQSDGSLQSRTENPQSNNYYSSHQQNNHSPQSQRDDGIQSPNNNFPQPKSYDLPVPESPNYGSSDSDMYDSRPSPNHNLSHFSNCDY